MKTDNDRLIESAQQRRKIQHGTTQRDPLWLRVAWFIAGVIFNVSIVSMIGLIIVFGIWLFARIFLGY